MGSTIFERLKDLLIKDAPLLAQTLGGPFAGIAVSLISSVFGSDSNPDEVLKSIIKDPEAAIKLKTLELQHQEELQKLQLQSYETEVDDRKNAREREKVTQDKVPAIIAMTFTTGYLLMMAIVIVMAIVDHLGATEQKLLDIAEMGLTNGMIVILSYYFGSSHKRE